MAESFVKYVLIAVFLVDIKCQICMRHSPNGVHFSFSFLIRIV